MGICECCPLCHALPQVEYTVAAQPASPRITGSPIDPQTGMQPAKFLVMQVVFEDKSHFISLFIFCTKMTQLKEYYDIVDEAHPQSGLFPTHADLLIQKCISTHETKHASKFQSDPSSNCFTIDV